MSEKTSVEGLPKRFYGAVTVEARGNAYLVLLDGRAVRTPAKRPQELPTRAVAELVAAEFDAQRDRINPARMPITRLANSAIDGVVGRERAVAASIAAYGANDLLCYRAGHPQPLIARQSAAWDPILEWHRTTHGLVFRTTIGIAHIDQPVAARQGVEAVVEVLDPFTLTAVHDMTTLTGSVLLAVAVAGRRLDPAEAWNAAHVDEDWQVSQWGEDAEARQRREARWRDFEAAAALVRAVEGH